MADAEISVLIKVVDQMSKDIEKIKSNIKDFSEESVKQTNNLTNAQIKQVKSLIEVGNAASSVDRIMSSYQNLQIRVENTAERLAAAQDRLRNSQYNLTKVQRDVNSTSEDIANAQREVESASRSLTIAQNNLQRINGQIVGTLINMGVQSLQLIQSFLSFKKTMEGVNITLAITQAITNPLYLLLGGLATVIGVGLYKGLTDSTKGLQEFGKANNELMPVVYDTNTALDEQVRRFQAVALNANIAASGILKQLEAQKELERIQQKIAAGKATRTDLAPKAGNVLSNETIAAAIAQSNLEFAQRMEATQTVTPVRTYWKNGQQVNISVGTVYGVSPKQIGEAMADEYYRKANV